MIVFEIFDLKNFHNISDGSIIKCKKENMTANEWKENESHQNANVHLSPNRKPLYGKIIIYFNKNENQADSNDVQYEQKTLSMISIFVRRMVSQIVGDECYDFRLLMRRIFYCSAIILSSMLYIILQAKKERILVCVYRNLSSGMPLSIWIPCEKQHITPSTVDQWLK